MKFLKSIVLVLASALVLLLTSYVGAYMFASNGPNLVSYSHQGQYVADAHNNTITSIKRGNPITIHARATKQPLNCYADYYVNLNSDTNSIQLNPKRSQYPVLKKISEFELHSTFDLSETIPAGHYRITQLAFPTCASISIMPFDTGLDLELDITE